MSETTREILDSPRTLDLLKKRREREKNPKPDVLGMNVDETVAGKIITAQLNKKDGKQPSGGSEGSQSK